jgi:hypothetical protein
MKIIISPDYSAEKRGIMKPSFRTGAWQKGEKRKKTRQAKNQFAIKEWA